MNDGDENLTDEKVRVKFITVKRNPAHTQNAAQENPVTWFRDLAKSTEISNGIILYHNTSVFVTYLSASYV